MARKGEFAMDTSDNRIMQEAVKNKLPTKGKNFTPDFEELLDSMLKIAPADRTSITNILHSLSNMDGIDHVTEWVQSDTFKTEFIDSRKTLLLMNNEWKLYTAQLTDKQIDDELNAYITGIKSIL